MFSALPARSTYRQQFDLSIPLILLTEEGIEGEEEDSQEERKEKLLLVPLVSISSGQRQDVVKEMKTMGKVGSFDFLRRIACHFLVISLRVFYSCIFASLLGF